MAYASWHTTVTDLQGNVIPNASIYVVNEVTGVAPQLYADRQGMVPMGNPFTAEADGTVSFYVAGGAYRIRASFGAWERTWRYVGIGTAQEVDVEGLAAMLQSGFSPVQTLADLNTITPTEFPAGGIVLADPVGANNGYYTNSGSGWVYSRPLPDTFARLYATGGTENNVQATLDAGVNPSSPTVFFIDVDTPNTGPVALTINGANTGPVLNAAGNPLAAGEWQGRVLFTREGNGDYKIMNDPASALSAAQSATQADTAREAAETARTGAEAARTGAESAQGAAASSASDAADSASAAQSSATAAAGSATAASNSASDAADSATEAAGSANTASIQAGNAASSASAAAGSATNAGNSATAAAGSATAATQQADRAEDEADRAEAAASSVGNAVTYTPQTPTTAEQVQARANIGAISASEVPTPPVTSVAGKTGAVTLSSGDISGLGGAATLNVGTAAGTVAAGNDSRITGALQASNVPTQAEAETGTATTARAWTAQRVRQNANASPAAAKAWVNFSGTGTVSIRSSYNVSSITDNGTGDYTVNFTTAMGSTTYSVVGAAGGAGTRRVFSLEELSSASARVFTNTVGGSSLDADIICIAVFRS